MSNESRLIGIISYFNQDTGVGRILTNNYGLRRDEKEQYFDFCSEAISDNSNLSEGDYVTFSPYLYFDKTGKSFSARNVSHLKYSVDEYELALHYCGEYSIVTYSSSLLLDKIETPIIKEVTLLYVKSLHFSDPVLQLLLKAHSAGILDAFDILLYCVEDGEESLNALFRPRNALYGGRGIESCLRALAIKAFNTYVDNYHFNYAESEDDDLWGVCSKEAEKYRRVSGYYLTVFSKCLIWMDNQNIDMLRHQICLRLPYIYHSLDPAILFLNNIDDSSLKLLWRSNELSHTPQMRLLYYRRFKTISALKDPVMIEYWNSRLRHGERISCYSLWDEGLSSQELSYYIAFNSNSSDQLLLLSFLLSSLPFTFTRIKDSAVCYEWFANQEPIQLAISTKQRTSFFLKFISFYGLVPDDTMIRTLKAIGLDNVSKALNDGIRRPIPDGVLIRISAVMDYGIAEEVVEHSQEYGGYWTWGEGMKHQKVDVDTFMITPYDAAVYIEPDKFQLVNKDEGTVNAVTSFLRQSIESRNAVFYFPLYINEEGYIAELLLQEESENSGSLWFKKTNQTARVLIKSETLTDD